MLQLFKVSDLLHIYRAYIKSFFISLIFRLNSIKDIVRRKKTHRRTKNAYRRLENNINFRIMIKKIKKSWHEEDFISFAKLNLSFLFAWPILLVKKINIFSNK
ncbi:hypothetical protein N9403_04830 [Gammaproteobacteria bacterium]|nr:hypothetical protein [Gammaproteobacteria bacterium]